MPNRKKNGSASIFITELNKILTGWNLETGSSLLLCNFAAVGLYMLYMYGIVTVLQERANWEWDICNSVLY
jgi:hypothetical protein